MTRASKGQWSGKSRGGALGTWFFVATIRHLGIGAAYTLLAFVVPYFVLFAPQATRVVWRYNRQILRMGVVRSFVLIYKHFYRFGQTMIDRMALKHDIKKPFTFTYDNYDEFLSVLDSGKGAVIISAHVGSWEVGAPFFRHYGKDMNIVMLDAEYQRIKDVVEKDAVQRDFKIIPLGDDGIESVMRIKAALDRKEYVCLQGDRYMAGSDYITAPFMGGEANFPRGVFHLAARLRVPVVFYFAMHEANRHYVFNFEIAKTDSKTTAQDLLAQYTQCLERVVTKYPQQWFNFYDFWTKYKA